MQTWQRWLCWGKFPPKSHGLIRRLTAEAEEARRRSSLVWAPKNEKRPPKRLEKTQILWEDHAQFSVFHECIRIYSFCFTNIDQPMNQMLTYEAAALDEKGISTVRAPSWGYKFHGVGLLVVASRSCAWINQSSIVGYQTACALRPSIFIPKIDEGQ